MHVHREKVRDRSHLSDTAKAPLIIVYGRRRIGKFMLIREAVQQRINKLNPPDGITVEPVLVTGVSRAVEEQYFFSQVLTLSDLLS